MDTSIWVAALCNEAATAAVQEWLADQPGGDLAVSDWVITEFSSALSLKIRTGQITPEHRADALKEFKHLLSVSLLTFHISPEDFHTAARLADMHQSGLRAGDALHLATCANQGHTLATLDKTLATTATQLGVAIRNPNSE